MSHPANVAALSWTLWLEDYRRKHGISLFSEEEYKAFLDETHEKWGDYFKTGILPK